MIYARMRNAKIYALQVVLFKRVFFMNHPRKWNSYCPKVTRDAEGSMLIWNFLSDSFVVLPSLIYLWNSNCANFHSWDKKGHSKGQYNNPEVQVSYCAWQIHSLSYLWAQSRFFSRIISTTGLRAFGAQCKKIWEND